MPRAKSRPPLSPRFVILRRVSAEESVFRSFASAQDDSAGIFLQAGASGGDAHKGASLRRGWLRLACLTADCCRKGSGGGYKLKSCNNNRPPPTKSIAWAGRNLYPATLLFGNVSPSSARRGMPTGALRHCRFGAYASCLSSVFRAACVFARCRRRSTWPSHLCARP